VLECQDDTAKIGIREKFFSKEIIKKLVNKKAKILNLKIIMYSLIVLST